MSNQDLLNEAMSEDELQSTVIDALELYGWMYFHDQDSRRNPAGFPDVIATHPDTGSMLVLELKKAKGRMRPGQQEWVDAFKAIADCTGDFVPPFMLSMVLRPKDLDWALTIIRSWAST